MNRKITVDEILYRQYTICTVKCALDHLILTRINIDHGNKLQTIRKNITATDVS